MKMLKRLTKKIIIYIVLFVIVLSSLVPAKVYATRGYDQGCGEYVSKYAKDYVNQYVKKDASGIYNNMYDCSIVPCEWTGGGDGQGVWRVCCTTGIQLMYNQALGIELTSLGWSPSCSTTMASINNPSSTLHQNFEVIRNEADLKPGDILCKGSHNEMYVGTDEHFNSGGGSPSQSVVSVVSIYSTPGSLTSAGGNFECAIRLKNSVQVDPSGKVTGTGMTVGSGRTIDYSNFFFNGIPDGKYSLAERKSIFDMMVDSLKELVNFFSGLIGYLLRGLVISIISVFDRLLNNTVESINDSPKKLEESGVSATNADDPYSMNRSVTIEGLIFNDIDLFDINIFKVD